MGNSKIGLNIERHLLKDERLLWSAAPVRKYFLKYLLSHDPMRFMGYYFFLLGLVFTIFGFSFLLFATPKPPPKEEAPGIIFSSSGDSFRWDRLLLVLRRKAKDCQAVRKDEILPDQQESHHYNRSARSHDDDCRYEVNPPSESLPDQ